MAERHTVEEDAVKFSYGACSSIGRASPCGGECCGIVPRQAPHLKLRGLEDLGVFVFLALGFSNRFCMVSHFIT